MSTHERLQMNQNTTKTTTTFEKTLENLACAMTESYVKDENGQSIQMDEAQLEEVKAIVETVKEKALGAFSPLYESLQLALAEQGEQIEALEAEIALRSKRVLVASASASASAKAAAVPSVSVVAVPAAAAAGTLPTVAWLKANRKSKKGGALTGYNCYTMWYMAYFKSGFPPKGSWEKANQKAYKEIASAYNLEMGVVKGPGAGLGAGPGVADITLPVMKGKGKAVTAFNVWTNEYMAKNPGAGFPPKGLWAKVPKEDVARYQAQAKLLQAQRA